MGSFSSFGSLLKRVPGFLDGLLCDCKQYPGNFFTDFCLHRHLKKNVSRCCLNFSITIFILYPYFLLLCRGGDNYIEVIEKIVSTVLRVFYCRLTLSRIEFAKFRTCKLGYSVIQN